MTERQTIHIWSVDLREKSLDRIVASVQLSAINNSSKYLQSSARVAKNLGAIDGVKCAVYDLIFLFKYFRYCSATKVF